LIDGCSVPGVAGLRIIVAADRAGASPATGNPCVHRVVEQFPVRRSVLGEREHQGRYPVAVLGYIGYNSIQWGTLMSGGDRSNHLASF